MGHAAHEVGMEPTPLALTNYYPNLPDGVWEQMSTFVCDTIAQRYADGRAPRDVQNALYIFTGYVDWVLYHAVGTADESVFNEHLIDAFTAARHTEVKAATAERERKVLRTIAGFPNTVGGRSTATSASPTAPYTDAEQYEIRQWAQNQLTENRRRDSGAVAALGLGCGLTSGEMLTARVRDLRVLDDGMVAVEVQGARTVPVLEEWNDMLAPLVDEDPARFVVRPGATFRGPGVMGEHLTASHGMTPSPQRMRATWLLRHVDAGTPLNNLLQAAGLTSSDFLRRVLPFALHLDGNRAVNALRLGTEVTR